MIVFAVALGFGSLAALFLDTPDVWTSWAIIAFASIVSVMGGLGRGTALGCWCAALGLGICMAPRQEPEPLPQTGGLYRIHAETSGYIWAEDAPQMELVIISSAGLSHQPRLPSGARVRVRYTGHTTQAHTYLVHISRPPPNVRGRWPWSETRLRGRLVAVPAGGVAPLDALERFRRDISDSMAEGLSPSSLGLARALVLGQRVDVSSADRRSVRASGLAHLLAISGMHVGLAIVFVYPLVSWFARRVTWLSPEKRIALPFIVCVPLPSIIALLSGNAPSAWRAAIMLMLALSIGALWRRAIATRLLAFTFAVLFAWDSSSALSLGSALSFLGALALVTMPRGALRGGRCVAAVLAALRPLLGTLPISTFAFGEVAPAALGANLLLGLPFAFLLLPLTWVHAFFSYAGLPLASSTSFMMNACAATWLSACSVIDEFFGLWGVGGMNLSALFGLCLLCIAGLVEIRRRWFWISMFVGGGALLGGMLVSRALPQQLRLHSIAVGQGDAHLVQFPDQSSMLIDSGPGGFGSRQSLRRALHEGGLGALDVVVITHAHPDHWGGLPWLATEFPMRELWLPDTIGSTAGSRLAELASVLASRGVRVRGISEMCRRSPVAFGDAQLRVLSPCRASAGLSGLNERSAVIHIEYAQRRYLFTGDIETEAEQLLVTAYPSLRADVLKVAHHGSRTSTSEEFLNTVQPRLAIIPCGPVNRFGHPHQEVVERLARFGSLILRTDQPDAVILEQRGANLFTRGPSESIGTPRKRGLQ